MSNLFKGNEIRVTEDTIYHFESGQTISMAELKGQNHLGIDPPIKDYILFILIIAGGLFCLVKGWPIIGIVLILFGGVAFWAAYTTKRHTHAISLFPYRGEMMLLYFFNEAEALEAYEVIAKQIARIHFEREQGED